GTIIINTGSNASQGNDGTVTLTGNNSAFTGGITIGSGNLLVTNLNQIGNGANVMNLGGGAAAIYGALQFSAGSGGFTVNNPMTLAGRDLTTPNVAHLQNVSGNNTYTGALTLVQGGSNFTFQSDSGTMTIQSPLSTAQLVANGFFGNRN